MGWLAPVAERQVLGSADSRRLREAGPDASPLSSEEAGLREGKSPSPGGAGTRSWDGSFPGPRLPASFLPARSRGAQTCRPYGGALPGRHRGLPSPCLTWGTPSPGKWGAPDGDWEGLLGTGRGRGGQTGRVAGFPAPMLRLWGLCVVVVGAALTLPDGGAGAEPGGELGLRGCLQVRGDPRPGRVCVGGGKWGSHTWSPHSPPHFLCPSAAPPTHPCL